MDEEGPPRKIAAVDYRFCPHCDQEVSKRTYRKHMALPAAFETVCSSNSFSTYVETSSIS